MQSRSTSQQQSADLSHNKLPTAPRNAIKWVHKAFPQFAEAHTAWQQHENNDLIVLSCTQVARTLRHNRVSTPVLKSASGHQKYCAFWWIFLLNKNCRQRCTGRRHYRPQTYTTALKSHISAKAPSLKLTLCLHARASDDCSLCARKEKNILHLTIPGQSRKKNRWN